MLDILNIIGAKNLWAAPQSGGGGAAGSLIMLLILFGIFYFLLILPQQRQAKKHREMINSLKKGDRVITTGGIIGTISGVADDTVTLQIADGVKVKVAKSYIASKLQSAENQSK